MCCVLLRVVACCCVLLRAAARCCALLRIAACCCLLPRLSPQLTSIPLTPASFIVIATPLTVSLLHSGPTLLATELLMFIVVL